MSNKSVIFVVSGFDKVKKKMKMEKKESKIEALKKQAQHADNIAQRRALIATFYEIIRDGKVEINVFNEDLQSEIHVNRHSAKETKQHAAKADKSTRAVFELIEILENAKKVDELPIKTNSKNQRQYEKMIILSYNIDGIGEVKLTVGVTKAEGKHIQYCLTAVE